MSVPLEVRVIDDLRTIPSTAWDALVSPSDTPFLRHAWLASLEEAGCVNAQVGWLPQHLTVWRDDRLIAALPVYVKGNYEGEFVFDHQWANAASRMGISYYPKLVVAVPFTPATGARMLIDAQAGRAELEPVLARSLRALCDGFELSGAHVLFPQEAEAAVWEAQGYASRLGIQYHWKNRGYQTWEDYLGAFNAKRRHQLRRERREVEQSGIETRTYRGREITDEVVGAMERFYLATVDRYYPWTKRYVNRRFFELVIERMPEHIEIVIAREGGRPIAGAFNVSGANRLYGRYWGATEHRPFLHFHVCYYHSIDACIARGIEVFEPGAGGEHKVPRGFEPTITRSAHILTDARLDSAVRRHLELEREAVKRMVEEGEQL